MTHNDAFQAMQTIRRYCMTRKTCDDCIFKRASGWASQSCKVGFPRNYARITKRWMDVIEKEAANDGE